MARLEMASKVCKELENVLALKEAAGQQDPRIEIAGGGQQEDQVEAHQF